jgi:hypothetical protein
VAETNIEKIRDFLRRIIAKSGVLLQSACYLDTLIRLKNNKLARSSEIAEVGMSLASFEKSKKRIKFKYEGSYEL